MAKVCIVTSYAGSVIRFRGDLIRSIVDGGHDVTVLGETLDPEVIADIRKLKVEYRPFWIQRNSTNFLSDWRTMREMREIFLEERPQVVLAYTIKPVIWGGIAVNKCRGVRFIAMITGLGYAFHRERSFIRRCLTVLVSSLYRVALRRSELVVFQNGDNRNEFVRRNIVVTQKCRLVAGSGVNLDRYEHRPVPAGQPPRFLVIARLLGEKGLREYAAAAKKIKCTFPHVVFQLVGPSDSSRDAIPQAELQAWQKAGVIEYFGPTSDVRPFLQQCHIYVLPSYHEGMPRTVLEAMATGRPILTTDVCGCRETVIDGKNGWLVPAQDADSLAARMSWFLSNRDQWEAMGRESRRLAEQRFNVRNVNKEMLAILGLS